MNGTTELEVLEKQEVAETNRALSLKVIDSDTYSEAGTILVAFKDMEKQIKGYFKPLKEAAHKSWKQLCDRENTELDKLKEGTNHLSIEMTNWNVEQEKIRKAEEEKLRLEAIKREEEERLQAAIQAEKEGSKEEAEAILAEPVHVACPIIPINVARVNGLAMRETWQFRVTDLKSLVKAVAEGKVPINAVIPDSVFLGQQARALKGTVNYPGVEFFSVKNMTGARR